MDIILLEFKMEIQNRIKERLQKAGRRFHANDNISEFIEDGELPLLQAEIQTAFQSVLEALVIDVETDPNSIGTAKRLAKMYVNELMAGRFTPAPSITSFPNGRASQSIVGQKGSTEPALTYTGLLVVPVEFTSMCSHHHAIVKGIAYIGIIPGQKVIGLSKYIRLCQHLAAVGTLQEQLTEDMLRGIQEATDTKDVAVFNISTHGCVTCRGVKAHNAFVSSAELDGLFLTNPNLRTEFYSHVNLLEQQRTR
jgi:GTP cyclohydrolase I